MSRKTKTIATQEKAKLVLVPKLRFPEFWGAEGWMLSVLVRACEMQAGKFVAASNISEHNQNGFFPCFGGNGLRGYTTTHTHDGTYPLIGRQGALCGNVRLVSGKFHATEHAVAATPKNAIDVGWLYYSLDLLNLNRFATGQAQPGLSVDVLENVSLAIPPLEAEQQKIADCLSSVDELIAAQALKVEALKTHKKGLMQQLFPREGETQPRLRFPEFQNVRDWETKSLGSFSKVGDIDHKMPSSIANGIPYIMTGDFFGINDIDYENAKKISIEDYKQLSKKIKPELGDIVIARYASVGAVRYIQTRLKFLASYSCAIIKCNKSEDSRYIYYALQSDVIQSQIRLEINTSSQKNIGIDSIKKLSIFIPTLSEQLKISDCLAVFDAQITAKTQQLDALKTHKKGLMQQLFPAPEATEV